MGFSNSQDIFQQKMNNLIQGIGLTIASIGIFILKKLIVHNMLKTGIHYKYILKCGLKRNIEKYFFGQTKMEYLGS